MATISLSVRDMVGCIDRRGSRAWPAASSVAKKLLTAAVRRLTEDRKSVNGGRQQHTKTPVVAPEVRKVPVAVRRARELRIEEPGAAAQHTPASTGIGLDLLRLVVLVQTPLPDIPRHIPYAIG